MKKTIVCLLAILLILAFVSCDSSVPKNIYTVTFDTDGGSAVSPVEVTEGDKVTKPDDPTKEGYTFEGWYLGEDAYDFEAPVTKAITLKAKQTEVSAPVVKHTVTFDTEGGSEVAPVEVTEGDKVTKPVDPTKKGFTFFEWQLDGKAYNFDTPVTANITLKATWEEVKYTVSFNANGAEGLVPNPIPVSSGESFTIPSGDNLTKEGYLFKEWNTNPEGSGISFKEETSVVASENLTLYAIFEKTPLSFTKLPDDSYSVKCKDRTVQSVVIPSKYQGNPVTTIDGGAFDNLSSIKSITIPSSVIKICKSAFWNCSSLETIIYQGTIEAWKDITRESGWAVSIKTKEIQCTNGNTQIN